MDTYLPCTLYMLTIICTNFGAFITKWTVDAPIDWTLLEVIYFHSNLYNSLLEVVYIEVGGLYP